MGREWVINGIIGAIGRRSLSVGDGACELLLKPSQTLKPSFLSKGALGSLTE